METDVPQAAVPKKKEPTKRAAARKKPLATVMVASDDEDDFEVEALGAPEAKKGGRKTTANSKASKLLPTATKKRVPNSKQSQVLGQKLLTEILKPAEASGISPEKKVRRMRASPFNKKSNSILGGLPRDDDEAIDIEEMSGSASTSDNMQEHHELPSRARPQRASRKKTYVLSDSDSSKAAEDSDDSDFDEDED